MLRNPQSRTLVSATAVITAILIAGAAPAASNQPSRVVIKNQGFIPFADSPINYRSSDVSDPVAKLEDRLEAGRLKLKYEPGHGYLRSVLEALKIPVSSQTLVFSKTSFQAPEINPDYPRALYFNDDVYVGQVHNGKFLEFISFDPRQGAIFYVMDERRSDQPRLERSATDCVQCHVAPTTRGIPGVFLRSVYTAPSGYQAGGTKAYITGQESPLSERWGGWYVTAARSPESGLANAVAADRQHPQQLSPLPGASLSRLAGPVKTADYLSGSSDIVALLVLAHQTQMHNYMTHTDYRTRIALDADQRRRKAAGQSEDEISDDTRSTIAASAEQLVRYLLFTNEAPLGSAIAGDTSFTQDFAARGPFDSKGRSLRQFDLHTRLFQYSCSYLIYSESFDAIPSPAKEYIYHRLFEVLSGKDRSPVFDRLSDEDRRAILEILVATKPGLPPEWKQFVSQRNALWIDRTTPGELNLFNERNP